MKLLDRTPAGALPECLLAGSGVSREGGTDRASGSQPESCAIYY